MAIFDLTIGKIIYLIETLDKILFNQTINFLKFWGLTFSLIISAILIYLSIRLEIKNEDEIKFWKAVFKSRKDYYFIKNSRKNFEKIKKIFYQNNYQGLIAVNNFLNSLLKTFGYEEDSLEEKLEKINIKFLPNKEEIKKARQALILIQNKSNENKEINLSSEDYLIIFHEYEKGLFYLKAITEEDFVVKNQE